MCRWIQLSLAELCEKNPMFMKELKSQGYKYNKDKPTDRTCNKFTHIEFHIDNHWLFRERMKDVRFGGKISVLLNINVPLICFGQDKCIFCQFIFSNCAWVTPDGIHPLVPKDEGMGLMVLAFVSCEFRFGIKLTKEDLLKVNCFREQPENHLYKDKEAAKTVLNQLDAKKKNE